MHVDVPPGLVLPTVQEAHDPAAGPEYVPGRHDVHVVSPATAYEPGEHAVHTSVSAVPAVV